MQSCKRSGIVEGRIIDLQGPLHVFDFGGPPRGEAASPPFVLVHGLGGSHANWLALGPKLARLSPTTAPDLPGFGRSPVAGRRIRIEGYVSLLARYLEREIRRPVVLVGNSMGGIVSLLLAAARPELVASLVLIGAPLPAPLGTPRDRDVMTAFALYMVPGLAERVMKKLAMRRTPAGEVREIMSLCGVDVDALPRDVYATQLALARDRRDFSWARPAFLAAARSLVPTLLDGRGLRRAIAAVRAPTLILQGDRDRLVPVASATTTHRLRPDFELALLEGLGHIPMLQAPDRVAEHMEKFLVGRGVLPASHKV